MTTILVIRKLKILVPSKATMRYLTFLLLVVSTTLHAGAIHKWVDENGNVHYGDAPPARTKSENVRVQSAPSNPGKALPRLNSPQEATSSGGGSSTQPQTGDADPDVSEEQSAQICNSARQNLEVLEKSDRVKLKAADGTTRRLTKAEIDQRKAIAQSEVEQYCN
jgi:hypothetical protein